MKLKNYLFTLFLLLGTFSLVGQETYQVALSGRHEVLPVKTGASGAIEATLNGNQLTLSGAFDDLEAPVDISIAGGAHLHLGYAGENGPVAIPINITLDLDAQGGVIQEALNTYMLTADQITALQNRRMYVNIHTITNTGGELRGQVLPSADEYYYINLLGSNEVPVAMTQASGAIAVEIHGDTAVLSGAFSGLEGDFDANIAGGAHLHTAMAGANGGVDISLNATTEADLRSGVFSADNNTFALSEAQKLRMETRGYYANLHSTKFPGGELRGQVSGLAQTTFRAHLSGANEVPTVTSAASGQVQAELIGDTLIVSGRFDGLESSVATDIAGGLHLHLGMAGENGPVTIPLNAEFDDDMQGGTLTVGGNSFVLTSEQKVAINARGMYVNIHTTDNTGGELRGQLLPESQIVFHGNLLGIFEVPSVSTTASGALKAELNGDQLTVSGSYAGLLSALATDIAGGAHLHIGAAGTTGPVELLLTSDLDTDLTGGIYAADNNTFTVDANQIDALRARMVYANIHSTTFTSGELRAQMVQEAAYYFTAPLSGASQTPLPVDSDAQGMVVMEVTNDKVVAHGGFSGLSSMVNTNIAGGAHLHAGMAGQSGPVIHLVSPSLSNDGTSGTFEASNNVLTFGSGDLDTLRSRGFYTNVHTMNFASGEIRGQALPLANAYFTTTLAGINEASPNLSEASGALKMELNGDVLTTTGAFSGLESDFNTAIAGGAHLHIGGPSVNGGVDILLNTELAANNRAGVYQAMDNTSTLNNNQISTLLSEQYYANLHSTAIASGELRGQILQEVNFFPNNAPTITAPADGALLDLSGLVSTVATIDWTETATDDNELTYIWQVATSPGFDTIVFQANTSANTEINLSFGALDSLLADLGVEGGATATVYHRAVASDGAVQSPGPASEANFTRREDPLEFNAQLSGRHEVLPVQTGASGSIQASLLGNELTITGSFDDLSSSVDTSIAGGAHLHIGYAGENGPVTIPISASLDLDGRGGDFLAADNTFTLDSTQMAALNARRIYANIHTTAVSSGELRGQLLPEADAYYYINLLGSNEVPVAMTQAAGALAIEVRNDTMVLSGAFAGLEGDLDANIAGGAHLHTAMAGANGGVDISINATTAADLRSGVFAASENTFVLNSDQIARLESRGYYANLHTTKFPGGELRGQVSALAQTSFRAHLSGANEVPTVTSGASGQIQAELLGDSLYVSGRFDDLESMVATNIAGGLHLHLGLAGENGPVAIPLNADLDDDMMGGTVPVANNTFVLTADQKTALNARGMYVNIHTTTNTGGELRGQLLPETQIVFHGNLLGIFEVPSVSTTASGALKAELNGNQLTVSGSYAGLLGLLATDIAGGAHLHIGAAGTTGPVEFLLTPSLDLDLTAGAYAASDNTFTLDSAQVAALRARQVYANIHSGLYNSGELRAQMVQEAEYYFTAPLSGASQTPAPIDTDAQGMLVLEVTNDKVVAHGGFNGLGSMVDVSIAGGAHLHAGMAGQSGPVVHLVNPDLSNDGTAGTFAASNNVLTFSAGQLDTLRNRGFYANIHSMNFASGEIRGQALPLANAYFTTTLAGLNEATPNLSDASGALKLELNGDVLTSTGAFSGLESDFNTAIAGGAHLHIGGPSVNGGVDILLNTDLAADNRAGVYQAADNSFVLDSSQITTLLAEQYYANLHSTEIASGELRGQILQEVNFFPDNAPAIVSPADGGLVELDTIFSDLITVDWADTATDDNELTYIWQVATSPGFDTIVFQANTAANTDISLTVGALDTLLASLGVEVGATATVYHRAVASDGAVQSFGPASEANFTRPMVTSTSDLLAEGTRFEVYPSITRGDVQVQAELRSNGQIDLVVFNAIGQPILRKRTSRIGTLLNERLDLSQEEKGLYLIQLWIDDQPVTVRKVIKQ